MLTCEVPEMTHSITIGDTVAFHPAYLDRHSRHYANMASALGKVIALHRLRTGVILADIDWNKPSLPKRVNIKNLSTTTASLS